jgi:3,4-dihydroxy 2-butanone 4-phosphate synthase
MHNLLEEFGKDFEIRVTKAVEDINKGKGVLLIDDEDRENEGDLIYSAEKMTSNDMALMIRECSGIVCLCIAKEKAESLKLPYMVPENTSRYQTPFTVSIEAKEGVTTGVSAVDRIKTIKTAIAKDCNPDDLARPGHVFPLIANSEGVLGRPGHTEGSVDLMKLSNLSPSAVLCELMNEDGTMAKLPQIILFAKKHEMTILSIEDIINYRLKHFINTQ